MGDRRVSSYITIIQKESQPTKEKWAQEASQEESFLVFWKAKVKEERKEVRKVIAKIKLVPGGVFIPCIK